MYDVRDIKVYGNEITGIPTKEEILTRKEKIHPECPARFFRDKLGHHADIPESPDELEAEMVRVNYPKNQDYDVRSLEPRGVTIDRMRHVEENIPELQNGGGSMLDIGSNKGFVALKYADRFDVVVGCEISTETFGIAEGVRRLHRKENVYFLNCSMIDVPYDREWPGKYDVVYAGSVHHHFFRDAVLKGVDPFYPLKKLVALCGDTLILDGPLKAEGDYSLNAWAKQYAWDEEILSLYTLANHVKALRPQFELQRIVDNERQRTTAIFKRVMPDIPTIDANGLRQHLKDNGKVVKANAARPNNSMYVLDGKRYKFDTGAQTDGIFMMLNQLEDKVLHTDAVIMENGKRVGDVAEWVDGEEVKDPKDLWDVWIELNNQLSVVGLIESHFKPTDYKLKNGAYVDVDVDMVRFTPWIGSNYWYLRNWRRTKADILPESMHDKLRMIEESVGDDWLFHRLMDGEHG